MSAARIREAAKVLRDAAENATGGLWASSAEQHENPGYGITQMTCAGCGWDDPRIEADAIYIALMQPLVALALADWLDAYAARIEEINESLPFSVSLTLSSLNVTAADRAVAIANTILGDRT